MEKIESPGSAHRASAQAASDRTDWNLKLPTTPPRLEDGRLLEYRHPAERSALALSLVALAALLVAAALLERREVLVGILAIWLSMVVAALQAGTLNTLRGAEVTPTQFPAIYSLAQELARRFEAPPTRLFVIRDPYAQAHTFGFRAPYVIVLHSALLDSLGPDELCYALGREYGHIRFGHTRRAILFGGDESTLPALFGPVVGLRDLIFAWYRRTEVMSGDRAGILACADVGLAMRTQVRLAVGTAQVSEVQPAALVEQAAKVRLGGSRVQAALIRLQSVTPPLIHRLEAMVEWAGLPDRDEPG